MTVKWKITIIAGEINRVVLTQVDDCCSGNNLRSALVVLNGQVIDTITDSDNDGVPDDEDICPFFDDNADADGDLLPDGCDSCIYDAENDADGDGLCGDVDDCPYTPDGEIINIYGCSVFDLCPCENDWKNHGAYVSCMAHETRKFVEAGLITHKERGFIMSEAGSSSCGAKDKNRKPKKPFKKKH